MNIPLIRLLNQQLLSPQFNNPVDLVNWMGALQGQNLDAAKWAIGVRLQSSTINQIEEAINSGQIVRTHIMRPTWHLVSGKNIRWMLALNRKKNERLYHGHLATNGATITDKEYNKSIDYIQEMLEGKKSMTFDEIQSMLEKRDIPATYRYVKGYLWRAENIGMICSGQLRGIQNTYTLLEEHVEPAEELLYEEALKQIATLYFQSHSPATLEDFTWWSGLNSMEAKMGIELIKENLVQETWKNTTWFIHDTCRLKGKATHQAALLSPFDEYLISYKDRTHALSKELYHKAFTNNGIFYPVIEYQGEIIGNWKQSKKKNQIILDQSFFKNSENIKQEVIEKAKLKYLSYCNI